MPSVMEKQVVKAESLLKNNAVFYAGRDKGYYLFYVYSTTTYRVRIRNKDNYDCECYDFGYRGHIRPCKHITACLIAMKRFFKYLKIRDDTE